MRIKVNTYKKKPIPVKAFQLYEGIDLKEINKIFPDLQLSYDSWLNRYKINTIEGIMECLNGDYVIQDFYDEFYACNKDVFEATYEKIE